MQKSFKGAWGQISPTSEKWLQATLLAKCEADRVRTAASSKVGTALPCLPVRFPFCKGTLFLIEDAPQHMLLKLSSHRFSYGILKANVETEAIISAHLAITQ